MAQQLLPRWRSLLYVPANNPKFVAKAGQRGADGVILDLEDGVPPDGKEVARQAAAQAIPMLVDAGVDALVRINAPLRLAVRDLEAVVQNGLKALLLTKTEDPGALAPLDIAVAELEAERGLPIGGISFIPMIESPAALFKAPAIAAACPRNVALLLGGEDFATEAGMTPGPDTLMGPKLTLALAAKSAGLLALGILDTVAALSADEAVEIAKKSARFGFDASTCVHPSMVPVLNAAFTPSEAEVSLAKRVITAMEAGFAQGLGAVRLEGRMIDMPVYRRAQLTVRRAQPR